ncbi:hypothetical protein ACMD2_23132 [Ananas comosus]|uniref:Methyltransferase type 11 domain-containing protein n=1 Tax=Ananas comosus TaxID=4615 RepID=A0A199VYW9_ANACO|nr:hypothetical protein ACMD2_23132 [Ananas comosus]
MERHVQRLLNRVSLVFATAATLSLLHLFFRSSSSSSYCIPSYSPSNPTQPPHHPQTLTLALTPFPRSSCDAASRSFVPLEKRSAKLRSSAAWRSHVASLSAAVFSPLRALRLLSNSSRVLCVSAGAGQSVAALRDSGVADVTGVDLLDFPPLVSRADPHNLPFFDGVFDLAFTPGLAGALFPTRFAAEMERTVRQGGAIALALEWWPSSLSPPSLSEARTEGIWALFRRSSILEVRNVTLVGSETTLIIMRNNGNSTT